MMATESGRLILRDGSTAAIRIACPEDRAALRAFFTGLSPASKARRFFSATLPPDDLIASLCKFADPRSQITLIITRTREGAPHIIAAGSYQRINENTTEVAFAVDDAFQGKGLGTILLERLALLAVRNGIVRFWAVTHPDNLVMRDVFRESGFPVQEKLEGGEMEVELSVVPTATSVASSEMRDRVATTASLRPFFQPRSVAVIGASRDPSSIGHRVFDALSRSGFRGPVYPVNLQATMIGALRAYPSARDLPEPVDLGVVAVPREAVLNVVDDCAARGIRALVVITAGFAEAGPEGQRLQERLVEKVRGYGMRMLGPNCLGLMNTDPQVRLNASFSPVFPRPGRIAMASQSGALGLVLLGAAQRLNLGLSAFVSIGNKADVSSNDLLQYWEEDADTDVILLYLESFGNPRRFARIARRVSRRKPIVVVKGGRTKAGWRAAGSHTAALTAPDVAVDALFQQTGIIHAETLEEMFDLAGALSRQPLPQGRRVAIVTNAGGPGILCADACETGGLVVSVPSLETKALLAGWLPATASLDNPIDMIAAASPEQYRRTIETVLAAPETDMLVVLYVSLEQAVPEAVVEAIRVGVAAGRTLGGADKPVLVCLMAEGGLAAPLVLEKESIPTYVFPEAAARVLSHMAEYAEWRAKPEGIIPVYADADFATARAVCSTALQQRGAGWLDAEETRKLLSAVGLPILPGGVARSAEEAAKLALGLGFPVAVKLASRHLVHKTEVGGVHLNLENEAAVWHAYEQIRNRLLRENNLYALEGVLVQPMLSGGVEVMVGMTQDLLFGPLIGFGLGGIHVEILRDVCFRVTPLTDRDAREMVRAIRGARLLQGYRGHPPADLEAVEDVLLRVSRLVEAVPEIGELDLNPIFAFPPGQGCRIVDARIRVAPAKPLVPSQQDVL